MEHPTPQGQDELGDIGRAVAQARDQLAGRPPTWNGRSASARSRASATQAQQQAADGVRTRAQGVIDETATVVVAELEEVVEQVEAVRRAAGTIDERVTPRTPSPGPSCSRPGGGARRHRARRQPRAGRVDGPAHRRRRRPDQAPRAQRDDRGRARRRGRARVRRRRRRGEEPRHDHGRSTEEITSTITSLERNATAMSSAIAGMTSGIKGVDEATGCSAGSPRSSTAWSRTSTGG